MEGFFVGMMTALVEVIFTIREKFLKWILQKDEEQ